MDGTCDDQKERTNIMTPSRSPFIDLLQLKPHVEGGWFREAWRSAITIPQAALPQAYSGDRQAATSVYFLLHPGEQSDWHVVLSEELWIWQAGGPVRLTLGGTGATPGETQEIILGLDIAAGQQPQALVPASVWQKAEPVGQEQEPTLFTCIVAPGFDFADFSLVPGK
jgi:predicted cupin superfamily sugar epimerase